MGFLSVLGMAHRLVGERLTDGGIAVDATVGGGNDTAFLAGLVGASGRVYGFDVQADALSRTRERLLAADSDGGDEMLRRVALFCESHDRMEAFVPADAHGRVSAVMFNLGYLPGGDHRLITRASSTIPALEAALRLLRAGGVATVVVYPGHPGGGAEAAAVADWCAALPQANAQALVYRFANQRNNPPYLIAIEKRQARIDT